MRREELTLPTNCSVSVFGGAITVGLRAVSSEDADITVGEAEGTDTSFTVEVGKCVRYLSGTSGFLYEIRTLRLRYEQSDSATVGDGLDISVTELTEAAAIKRITKRKYWDEGG
jgi:hypothetical protein